MIRHPLTTTEPVEMDDLLLVIQPDKLDLL